MSGCCRTNVLAVNHERLGAKIHTSRQYQPSASPALSTQRQLRVATAGPDEGIIRYCMPFRCFKSSPEVISIVVLISVWCSCALLDALQNPKQICPLKSEFACRYSRLASSCFNKPAVRPLPKSESSALLRLCAAAAVIITNAVRAANEARRWCISPSGENSGRLGRSHEDADYARSDDVSSDAPARRRSHLVREQFREAAAENNP